MDSKRNLFSGEPMVRYQLVGQIAYENLSDGTDYNPEKKMLAALLIRALSDLELPDIDACKSAERWFDPPVYDPRLEFSFPWTLRQLGIEVHEFAIREMVRSIVKRNQELGAPPRRTKGGFDYENDITTDRKPRIYNRYGKPRILKLRQVA